MPPTRTHAAQPTRIIFDPWNSSSTGHQRAENRLSGSTAWRESRSVKLAAQFASAGGGGGPRVADAVGGGSPDFGKDGRSANGSLPQGAPGLRERGQRCIVDCFRPGKVGIKSGGAGVKPSGVVKPSSGISKSQQVRVKVAGQPAKSAEASPFSTGGPSPQSTPSLHAQEFSSSPSQGTASATQPFATPRLSPPPPEQSEAPKPAIFKGLVFHINGSTQPAVSDHRLRQMIAQHGGMTSINLARRAVTHVVLGIPNSTNAPHRGSLGSSSGSLNQVLGGRVVKGAGGGLAASKIQRETLRGGKKGVRYVSAEWIVECVRRGKRVGEAGFAVKMGGMGGGYEGLGFAVGDDRPREG